MKKFSLVLLMLCVMLFAAGCGAQKDAASEKQQSSQSDAEKDDSAQADSAQADGAGGSSAAGGALVVYFSRMGNTDFDKGADAVSSASLQKDGGDLKGNAQMMAEWLADEAGCGTFEIVSEKAYSEDYDETVDQAKEEQNQDARPALSAQLEDPDQYDTIYLVTPNWWGDLPMPVYTFFDEYDFSGKTLNVFVTHEGSGFSRIVSTIEELEPDATVVEGLDVRGGDVPNAEADLRDWVKRN